MRSIVGLVAVIVLAVTFGCGDSSSTSPTPIAVTPPPPPPPPRPIWTAEGVGNTVFDKPREAERVRIEGEYNRSGSNFIVYCAGRLVVNEIIGRRRDSTTYSGVHNMSRCGEVEIVSSDGVMWKFTEIR